MVGGNFPRPGTVLLVDSLAAAAGGAVGASSATTYIESASGAAVPLGDATLGLDAPDPFPLQGAAAR